MFNDDQRSWMAYLASLPREQKCGCGWDRLWECFNCNIKELHGRGGQRTGDNGYLLPNGTLVNYRNMCLWLRGQPYQSVDQTGH